MDEEMKVEHSLVPLEKYLEAGVHIGSRFKTGDMAKFIYKCRNDGLYVLHIATLNERIKITAKLLSRYDPSKILIVAARDYAQKPAKKLSEIIGAKAIIGRFIPGALTNPNNENFIEPEIVFAADPPMDRQVIKEAVAVKIPVISLADTSNLLKNIDLVIPSNNKGKKALALLYWLITREILKEKKIITSDKQFTSTIEEFESTVEKERRREYKIEKIPRRGRFRGRRERK